MDKWTALAALIIGVLGYVVGWAVTYGQNKQWRADVDKQLDKQSQHHSKHFEHEARINVALQTLGQQHIGHAELDDERFGRIEELMKEMRDDIKTILKAKP